MTRRLGAALMAAVLVALAGATAAGAAPAQQRNRLTVAAAFYPVAFVAEQVGGNRVRVTNLTPVGVEAHDLELTTRQRDIIEDAAVVLVMGSGFQPSVEEAAAMREGITVSLLERLPIDGAGRPVAHKHKHKHADEHAEEPAGDAGHAGEEPAGDAGHAGEEPKGEHAHEHGHAGDEHGHADDKQGHAGDDHGHTGEEGLDPHVWLDPTLMGAIVDEVAAALTRADPAGRARYAANAAELRTELDALDARFRSGLADCDRRLIVTAHESFGYLAEAYGLLQEGIAGLSPDEEPNPRRMAELTDMVETKGVTTIFTEELLSPRIARTLAREAGGLRTDTLNPLEGLTPREIDRGDDYISVMDRNLRKLRGALGCR